MIYQLLSSFFKLHYLRPQSIALVNALILQQTVGITAIPGVSPSALKNSTQQLVVAQGVHAKSQTKRRTQAIFANFSSISSYQLGLSVDKIFYHNIFLAINIHALIMRSIHPLSTNYRVDTLIHQYCKYTILTKYKRGFSNTLDTLNKHTTYKVTTF